MFTTNELRLIVSACFSASYLSRQYGHVGQADNFDELARKAQDLADAAELRKTGPVHQPPPCLEAHRYGTCTKCGTPKVAELFKGCYCPRCNDWC